LATSLSLPIDTPLPLASIELPPDEKRQQTKELVELAKKQRADLMAKRATLSAAYFIEDKIQASYQPKLTFSAIGKRERSLQHHSRHGHNEVVLTLDVPLFEGFISIYENRMAFADTKITIEELAQLELDIALEVLTYDRSLEAAQEKLSYSITNLKSTQAAFDGVLEKYKAGKETIFDVSRAQEQLAIARLRHSDVYMEWLVSVAKLAYATGTLTGIL
ncbi:MAG: TolC family protein, partial [Verrucomicrobia bacterium]|nr:TolC family protein [Verrucomicrobiota bacterium]